MKTLLVCNWKMNPPTLRDAKALFVTAKKVAEKAKDVSILIAPPALFLSELRTKYNGKKINFALQHARVEGFGAYTGDVSLLQGKSCGATHVIIGHAERRAQGETDSDVRSKVNAALALSLVPIVCVGEKERGAHGEHFDVVREQLRAAFTDVPAAKANKVIVAYEPVWAIGAPTPMQTRDMHEMSIFIRKALLEHYAQEVKLPRIAPIVLYGGAVDEHSAALMLKEGEVSGFLVGRASSNPVSLTALVTALA